MVAEPVGRRGLAEQKRRAGKTREPQVRAGGEGWPFSPGAKGSPERGVSWGMWK